MYAVSQDFVEAIKADKRRFFGKVQIDYTDPFIDQSIGIAATENANVSYPNQTADSILEPLGKILSLDGSCVLDGSYVLAPAPDETDSHQMGWWGSQLPGVGGVFAEPFPKLTATFMSRPIRELKVVGDVARQEWPVDFKVQLYDQVDTILYTATITNNADIEWQIPLDPVITEVVKMDLVITKWSHDGRQAKIIEFFTSIQEAYEGDDILFIHLLEEREVSRGSLPVGNISANEIDIRLFNKARKFDAGNKQSPLYQTLKANRRIKAWVGIETPAGAEYVPLGVFWSGDWNAPEQDIYVHTTGRDRLELLRKSTYSTSQVQLNKSLYDLAAAIFIDAGLTQDEYWIDPELQQYIIPYAYFTNQSHREALRKIAEACLGQCYCNRQGVIRVEGPSYLEGMSAPVLDISRGDYFAKDNPVKWSEIANYIEVETQPLRPDVEQEVYKSNQTVAINAGETITITVYYNQSPCIDAVATLQGVGTINSATYYAWGGTIKVSSDTSGEFVVIINAKPLKVLNKEKAIAQDENSIVDNGKLTYTFPKNPLVQNKEIAQTIADRLLLYYKNPRRDATIDWRGNPALLLGDRISVTDSQEVNEYHVVSQDIEFDGGLRAKLSGRRVI